MSRWRQVKRASVILDNTVAAERYAVIGISEAAAPWVNYGAATPEEARVIAQRLRGNTAIQIIVIYRAEELWRRRDA